MVPRMDREERSFRARLKGEVEPVVMVQEEIIQDDEGKRHNTDFRYASVVW